MGGSDSGDRAIVAYWFKEAAQRKKKKQKERTLAKGRPVETAALWKSIKVADGNIFWMISTVLENAAAKNSAGLFTVTTRPDGQI